MAEVTLKAPVRAIHVANFDDYDAKGKQPGSFWFAVDKSDQPKVINFSCPCGCGAIHGLSVPPADEDDKKYGRHLWDWDGNREAPTVSPSIRAYESNGKDTHWHGFLKKGFFRQDEGK